MISHFAQKSPKNTHKFLHIAQRTPVHPIVHIVQWSGISHFYVLLPLKTVQRAYFLLNFNAEGTFFAQFYTKYTDEIVVSFAFLSHISCKNVENTSCPRYTTSEHTVIVKYYGMFLY